MVAAENEVTDTRTDGRNDKTTTVTLAAHARRGLTTSRMHYGASVSEVVDSTAARSKLSSHHCLVDLDSVIGERGRSSFSMVDCLKTVVMKTVVTRVILTAKTEVVTARLAFGTVCYTSISPAHVTFEL